MMMKRNFYFLIGVLSALFLSGCAKEIPGAFWGETEHYKNFLWVDYEPVRMEQTLVFDFNEDSKNLLTEPVRFEIVEKDLEGNIIQPHDINVYVNGELCPSNIFSVTKDDTEIPLCIIFKDYAREGNHTLFLREAGNNGLDRVEYLQLDEGFVVKKKDVTNPLQLGVTWAVIIIAIILVVWILLVKLVISPATPFHRVTFSYPDGTEKVVRMNGANKLVCSNKSNKCSLLKSLFAGKITYETSEYWTSPVTIRRGRRGNEIRISGAVDVVNDELVRKEEITLINENNEKIVIETN